MKITTNWQSDITVFGSLLSVLVGRGGSKFCSEFLQQQRGGEEGKEALLRGRSDGNAVSWERGRRWRCVDVRL